MILILILIPAPLAPRSTCLPFLILSSVCVPLGVIMGCGASTKQKYQVEAPAPAAPGPAKEQPAAVEPKAEEKPSAAEPQAEPPAKDGGGEGAAAAEEKKKLKTPPKKADFFADEDIVSVRNRYPEWAGIFDALDTGKTGSILMKELVAGLRAVCGDDAGVTLKTVKILFHAMDQNNDGGVDFKEFCIMGDALSKGDFSNIKGVDPKDLKKLQKAASGGLMAKAKGNLVEGMKNGNLLKLCDSFDAEQLRQKNPDLATVFDACGSDGTAQGVLNLKQLRNALRKMCPKVSGKQIATLYNVMDENQDGTIDFPEFVKMLRAIQTGDVSAFKGVDAAAFQEAFASSEALREKAKSNLLNGLKSGELAKLTEGGDGATGGGPLSAETKKKTAAENPEWAEMFEAFNTDKSGVLSFKEVNVALCRICKQASSKQVSALFKSMDENADGTIDLKEFCNMARALETGDLSKYPKVDPVAFKAMVEEKENLRLKVSENLKAGLESGNFMSLMDQWDADQEALKSKHPEFAKQFEKLDTKQVQTLNLPNVTKAIRAAFQEKKIKTVVTNKQIAALFTAKGGSADGRIDLADFCAVAQAAATEKLDEFLITPEEYRKIGVAVQSAKEKAKNSLKGGFASGEVAALLNADAPKDEAGAVSAEVSAESADVSASAEA